MNRTAKFVVVESPFLATEPLIIRDVGPWDLYPTVTNDAENVVRTLLASRLLLPGQRLHYYDSEGQLAEILIHDGRFAGFAPVESDNAGGER
ncbi:MAG: hypothetical protein IT458_08445 [Planctomycetes bacterium]|nr:hypothetical protein [Planctomycetota bacterium]